jgi:UDP-N-acetylmuramoyl-tripeptide--D-alanyl-D-alanine ligase
MTRNGNAGYGLWTAGEAQAAAQGALSGAHNWEALSLSIDTRSLQPGALFVALKAERDGHDFVPDAFAKGAVAALVSRRPEGCPESASLLIVPDSLKALEALARARRSESSAKFIAVTGSVGKTSTKEALKLVLAEQGVTHASAASLNNHYGTPLTVARTPRDAAFAVIEIGMNHANEIRALAPMAKPHVAVVTSISAVHLEHFSSVEDIADAKAEIFEGLVPGGAAVINADNPYSARLKAHAQRCGARIVTFGQSESAQIRLSSLKLHPNHSEAQVTIGALVIRFRIASPGLHMAMNSCAVLAAVDAAGADPVRAAAALAQFKPVAGRGTREVIRAPQGAFTLIDESYNANPASMNAAIVLLAQTPAGPGGRRIAVLGDMLELGASAPQLHAGLSQPLQCEGIDAVFACGPMMRHLWDALDSGQKGQYGMNADEIAPVLASEVQPGDVVMVKGSNGSKMIRVVEALRRLQRAA